MKTGKSICVKIYLKPALFAEMAQQAEKADKRRKGLLLFTQKEHGFCHEKLANTDGIARFLKHTYRYWVEHETQRLQELAELEVEERNIQERKKKLGVRTEARIG